MTNHGLARTFLAPHATGPAVIPAPDTSLKLRWTPTGERPVIGAAGAMQER
jgi:hypothetical protein